MRRNRLVRIAAFVVSIVGASGAVAACSGSDQPLRPASSTVFTNESDPSSSTQPDRGASSTTMPERQACSPGEVKVQRDVSYGPAALDIFPTENGCEAPVLMFVHGGGYCCGNKGEIGDQVIQWANDQGYTFVAVEYRLRVQYPVFDQDVAEAIEWVRTHASTFGADGNRIALMGHSTGGSMAAELATTASLYPTFDGIKALDCAVLLDPSSLDLAGKMANNPSQGVAATIRKVYGSTEAAWRSASAWSNANDGDNVAKLLIATRGNQAGEQNRFAQRLREHGTQVQIVNAKTLNHGQVLNNIGRQGDQTMTSPVQAFLNDCLGSSQN